MQSMLWSNRGRGVLRERLLTVKSSLPSKPTCHAAPEAARGVELRVVDIIKHSSLS